MIESAIQHIPADDRDIWVSVAMALKDELGDTGFDLWDNWSQSASNYKANNAKSVWRSIKQGGGITIRTLYKLARDHGYVGDADVAPRHRSPDTSKRMQAEAETERRRRQKAADDAADMIKRAEVKWHPYLVSKGFPKETGLVLDGDLLLPMRDFGTGRITSLQRIDAEGNKKFLYGGKAKGSVFIIGSGQPTYLCEGYATGLSIRSALKSMYSPARVMVCFSASNLMTVAAHVGEFVVADHDESDTGRIYAEKTGLPYWMPPEIGDANDYYRKHGARALADCLRELRAVGRLNDTTLATVPQRPLPGGVPQR